jgi:CRP/FNR family transcriptional regulator, cyclic AMP receptor protein
MTTRFADSLTATDVPSHHVAALARLGTHRRYRRGTLLIQEGETGDTLYIVVEGRLRAFLGDESGKELTLGMYGPLEYVGEMSLDGGPRSAHVEAVVPSVCSLVTRAHLLSYIAEQPEFAFELMGRLIRRARLATESARSVALIDVYGRLVLLLNGAVDPAASPDSPRRLTERMTHQQIAQHLACSREMVSRLLKDLETGGYIEVRDRWIWLTKPLPPRW